MSIVQYERASSLLMIHTSQVWSEECMAGVTHGDLRVELLCYRECIFRVLATGENINYGNDGIYKSESRRMERWGSTRPM